MKTISLQSTRSLALGLLAAALLSACGGSSDADAPVTPVMPVADNKPPASAAASTSGLVSYTSAQTALSADTTAVVELDDFVLPSDAMDSAVAIATPNDA